jgi:hypothetical protein
MKAAMAVAILLILTQANLQGQMHAGSNNSCESSQLFKVHSVIAWGTPSEPPAFFYSSGMAIDADGASRAYHPKQELGLDSLNHAGHPGNWWALVTDNLEKNGRPVVQGPSDPAPGYYVSTTSLYDSRNQNPRDPHRYVDASNIPFVVLPPEGFQHARLGDFATVANLQNGRVSAAIVADESAPGLKFGEGSIALAEALGIESSPRNGGKDRGVAYVIYPGSGNGEPRSLEEITDHSQKLFESWGGIKKLKLCLSAHSGAKGSERESH